MTCPRCQSTMRELSRTHSVRWMMGIVVFRCVACSWEVERWRKAG